jgi:hypothetical protein
MLAARTVDRSRTALLRRRDTRGPRGGDLVVVALGLPWQLLTAGAATFFAMILPCLVGISAAFIVASGQAGSATSATPGSPSSLAGGMIALLLTAWWGPGGATLRHGARVTAKVATRPAHGRIVVWSILALVVVAALLVLSGDHSPDWGPLSRSRLFDLLG